MARSEPGHPRQGAARRLWRGALARGVSLIELMVGLAIGLALVAFVLQGYGSASGNANVSGLVAEFQTNGRYALETLRREVRHAALSPWLWDGAQVEINAAAAARDYGCGAGQATLITQGLWAANDTNPFAGSCLAAGSDRSYLRGDVLVLRRLSLDPVAMFPANAPFVRVAYGSGNVFLGGEAPLDLRPPVFDHALLSEVYFVNAFTQSPDETPRVPALYRLTLSPGANPVLVPQLVASNVEHLQLQFGVGDGAGNVRYVNANDVADWGRVNAVRLWLLVRASEPEAGLATTSYTLGDLTYTPPADGFRRAVLTSTIHVRNR